MTDYGELFRELAIPRLVGTPNHQRVRETLKRELAARGFGVEEHAFSRRSGGLFWGAPSRIDGINLIAQRPSGRQANRPLVWLVAHYDSKGQPFSMLSRLLWVATMLLALLTLWVAEAIRHRPWWTFVFFVVLAASWMMNRATDTSPGAVDNATALVAVFMTLDQLSAGSAVGVIFPDAEEYGLVGARALATDRPGFLAGAAIVNLDGLDDVGRATALMHRGGDVTGRVVQSLGARSARWLPVVVDGSALSRDAAECVTIMKGTVATMRVVHTPHDTVTRVRLDGAALVAAGLARVLRAL